MSMMSTLEPTVEDKVEILKIDVKKKPIRRQILVHVHVCTR